MPEKTSAGTATSMIESSVAPVPANGGLYIGSESARVHELRLTCFYLASRRFLAVTG